MTFFVYALHISAHYIIFLRFERIHLNLYNKLYFPFQNIQYNCNLRMTNGGTWNHNNEFSSQNNQPGWQNFHHQYGFQPGRPNQYLQHGLPICPNATGPAVALTEIKKEPPSEIFNPFVVCSNQRQYTSIPPKLEQLPLQPATNPPAEFQFTNPVVNHAAYVNQINYFTGQVAQMSQLGE